MKTFLIISAPAQTAEGWTRWCCSVDAVNFEDAERLANHIYSNFLINGRPAGHWPEVLDVAESIALPAEKSNPVAA